jgi:hypothetical protein
VSADNYLLVVRVGEAFEVHHLFASDDEPDLNTHRPMYAGTRDEALRFAHTWAMDNVCEYGVSVMPDVWDGGDAA